MLIQRTYRPKTTAWCDGSCTKAGAGGWGVYLRYADKRAEQVACGGAADTTISRMELTATIMAVAMLPHGESCLIYSDSKYVVDGINDYLHMWLRTGWRSSANEPLKNLDLWQELHRRLFEKDIELRWVKGHSHNFGNDRADGLARIGRLTALGDLQSIAK